MGGCIDLQTSKLIVEIRDLLKDANVKLEHLIEQGRFERCVKYSDKSHCGNN